MLRHHQLRVITIDGIDRTTALHAHFLPNFLKLGLEH